MNKCLKGLYDDMMYCVRKSIFTNLIYSCSFLKNNSVEIKTVASLR